MSKQRAVPVVLDDAERRRDRELRRLVEADPADAAAVAVYADWLEERGDLPRATFLRLQQQLRGLTIAHPRLLQRGRELHALGKTLPASWIAAVTHPKVAGTAWDGRDDDGALVWRFLPGGKLNYTQPSGTYENGTWEQIGVTVAMETNAHYADYFGVIVGDVMRGDAKNIVAHAWRWKVTCTTDPTIVPVPAQVNRTVHDHHRRGQTTAKPDRPAKRRTVAKRAKPLPRKQPLRRKATRRRRAP